jgi:Neuraminidase (sialidase)
MEEGNSAQTGEITDRTQIQELSLKLYDRINQCWQTSPTFTQNLVYRVSATLDGAIANFEPLNQPAKDFIQETPLSNLNKSSQTESNSHAVPTANFTVVFAPNGILEVNP